LHGEQQWHKQQQQCPAACTGCHAVACQHRST
jgi:hypothetical protein